MNNKTCLTCSTKETTKWFNGPLCRKCYRQLPHVKQAEKNSGTAWRKRNKDHLKQYIEDNKEQKRLTDQQWYEKNKTRLKEVKKIYRKKNAAMLNNKSNQYQKTRKIEDIDFKLRCVLRSRISKAIKNNQKTGSAVKDLGCPIDSFKKHLESQFTEGMSWSNYGRKGWHIDHIKPLSSFDLTDPEQFKKACHYSNLQPLWAEDNLKKSNKII